MTAGGLKVAIVGYGRIGRVHAAAVRAERDVSRVVICDPALATAEAETIALHTPIYGGVDAMLAAVRPDVVHVCTPPTTHASIAARALRAGARVLVEKPMTVSTEEAGRLAAALRDDPGLLCVDHNFLFEPEMLVARQWVAAGRIGRVVAVDAFYGVDSLAGVTGPGAWSGALPGGRFTDLLPHPIYLTIAFLGPVRGVSARWRGQGEHGEEPTELAAVLECERGLGVVHVSLATVPWELGITVRGTQGTIRVDLARQRAILLRPSGGTRQVAAIRMAASVSAQTAVASVRRVTGKLSGRLRGYPGLRTLIARFYASIRDGLPPPVSVGDGDRLGAGAHPVAAGGATRARTAPRAARAGARMTIAVTGATGYVGTVLVERLLAAGASVRALVRNPDAPLPAGVERALADLTCPNDLEPALRGAEIVVHCAAEQRSPSRACHRDVNVAGTRALLEAARAAGVRRVVHLSSIAVYPRRDGTLPVSPDDPVDPFPELRDAYAWSKIGAERWVALHRRQGLDIVTLRLGIVYGRGRDFVARVWRRLVGPVVVIAGSPRMFLPLVHVNDVAEAVWRAADARRVAAPVLNVVGPETPTQASYLARRAAYRRERLIPLYVSLAGFQRLVRHRAWARGLRPGAGGSRAYALAWSAQRTRYDLLPTERALGWAPRIGLDDGLRGPSPSDAMSIAAAG